MGDDSVKRTSPKSMPASRALAFRNKAPRPGPSHTRNLTLDNIAMAQRKPQTAAFTARPQDLGQQISGLKVAPLMGISQFQQMQNSLLQSNNVSLYDPGTQREMTANSIENRASNEPSSLVAATTDQTYPTTMAGQLPVFNM